jgi:hypothetical protein
MTFAAMIGQECLQASRRKPACNGAANPYGGFDSSPINRFGLLRYSAMGGRPGNWADGDIPRNCGAVRLIHREMENPNFVLFPANRDGILMPRFLKAV